MQQLRTLRKSKKMSMKEFGNIIGVSESTISLYENGKREPDYNTLKKIADYFNVTTDYLLGVENEQKNLHPSETDECNNAVHLVDKEFLEAKNKLINIVDSLTPDEQDRLIEYARFLKSRKNKSTDL